MRWRGALATCADDARCRARTFSAPSAAHRHSRRTTGGRRPTTARCPHRAPGGTARRLPGGRPVRAAGRFPTGIGDGATAADGAPRRPGTDRTCSGGTLATDLAARRRSGSGNRCYRPMTGEDSCKLSKVERSGADAAHRRTSGVFEIENQVFQSLCRLAKVFQRPIADRRFELLAERPDLVGVQAVDRPGQFA